MSFLKLIIIQQLLILANLLGHLAHFLTCRVNHPNYLCYAHQRGHRPQGRHPLYYVPPRGHHLLCYVHPQGHPHCCAHQHGLHHAQLLDHH